MASGGNRADDNTKDHPDLDQQKREITDLMKKSLKKGETWYLCDTKWFKSWKKYVGYDEWDNYTVGDLHPGPIDNAPLLNEEVTSDLKEHLIDELDYVLLSQEAWDKLRSWYGLAAKQIPIDRKVIEQGMFVKHCKVEIYMMDLKLVEYSNLEEAVISYFSRCDTVADVEKVMRKEFNIEDKEVIRLWKKYMSNTYELLSKRDNTLQDFGMYSGQVVVIEQRNEDGTWPRQNKRSEENVDIKIIRRQVTKQVPSLPVQRPVPCEFCDEAAKHYCQNCSDALCPGCKDSHLKNKRKSHHKIVPYEEKFNADTVTLCRNHGQQIMFWCTTCKEVCCAKCATTTHQGHSFTDVQNAIRERKDQITEKLNGTYSMSLKQWKSLVEDSKKATVDYMESMLMLDKQLIETAQQVHHVVDDVLQNAREKLNRINMPGKTALQTQEEVTAQKYQELQQRMQQLSNIRNTNDASIMETEIDWVLPAPPTLDQRSPPTYNPKEICEPILEAIRVMQTTNSKD